MDKTIKQLRLFFRISNASFDVVDAINVHLKNKPKESEMKQLHKIALEEIEKEDPDMKKIYKLLTRMETIAGQPIPKPNFD